MTNPVSINPESQYPSVDTPVIDLSTGRWTVPWARSILGLWLRTGGADGVNSSDVQTSVAQALNDSEEAKVTANLALADASGAQSTANTAQATANAAQITANAAAAAAGGAGASALTKANNLSDVANVSASRVNLGLQTLPVTFQYDILTNGLTKYVPIVRSATVQNNLFGTVTWAGTLPTADAVFTLKRIVGGVTSTIGTVTIVHASNAVILSGTQTTLNAGDILALTGPNPADSTLAYVGISLALILN